MANRWSEEWRPVPGFEGLYVVSDKGKVRSKGRVCGDGRWHAGKLRKLVKDKDGYFKIGLYVDGKGYFFRVHRLVWEAFHGPIPDGMEINHKDGDKTNNHINNLNIVTTAENLRHKLWVLGRRPKGVKNSQAKLNPDTVRYIRKLRDCGYTYEEIANEIEQDVKPGAVGCIIRKETWTHVK